MGSEGKQQILEEILQRKISAIIRTSDERLAEDAMAAAVAGGFRMVEFTLTTPNALGLITRFAENPELLVGAGTVLTPQQARDAVSAGATFCVSPVCDPAVIKESSKLNVCSIPGTFTATEMLHAQRFGADLVKLFPAPADVRAYVAAILGPLPTLRIFPTAGVDAENFLDILRAGAAGVGFVRSLFDVASLQARDFKTIEKRARLICSRFQESQQPKQQA